MTENEAIANLTHRRDCWIGLKYVNNEPEATNGSRLLYAGVDITNMIVKIAEEMRGAVNG